MRRTHLEQTGTDEWAVVDTDRDVQVGWCRRHGDGWVIEDSLDGTCLGGPFPNVEDAGAQAERLLHHRCGIGNPGW